MFPGGLGTVSPFEVNTVNFRETGTIPSNSVNFEAFMEADIQVIPVLLNDDIINTRVFVLYMACPTRSEIWLHPIIRHVLWRYRSSLNRVNLVNVIYSRNK